MGRIYIIDTNYHCSESNLAGECRMVTIRREFSLTLAINKLSLIIKFSNFLPVTGRDKDVTLRGEIKLSQKGGTEPVLTHSLGSSFN